MAKILCLFAALALLQTALALKCNQCTDLKCQQYKEEECHPPTGQEASCITEVYKEKQTNEMVTIVKCVNSDMGKKYACIARPNTEQVRCDTCQKDLCNSATSMGLSALVAMVAAALFFVPRFV